MQDDLQKAYAAYQQALYLLPNPKVRPHHFLFPANNKGADRLASSRKTPSCGTALVSCMTVMGRWITPKKHSLPFSGWIKVGHLS